MPPPDIAVSQNDDAHCLAELRARDPDRWRVTLWSPTPVRPRLAALFALDLELARVVETTTEPMIGRIRLAWWRERLEALDDAPPPAHPVLRALALHWPGAGERLAALEDGALAWADGDLDEAARLRGSTLFALAADALGGGDPLTAGPAWAAGSMRRAGLLLAPVAPPRRLPRNLRPLLALARLGNRDPHERADAPARQLTIARTMILG